MSFGNSQHVGDLIFLGWFWLLLVLAIAFWWCLNGAICRTVHCSCADCCMLGALCSVQQTLYDMYEWYVCIYVMCMHACMFLCMICIYLCDVYVCLYVCMYVFMFDMYLCDVCVCLYVCMYDIMYGTSLLQLW